MVNRRSPTMSLAKLSAGVTRSAAKVVAAGPFWAAMVTRPEFS